MRTYYHRDPRLTVYSPTPLDTSSTTKPLPPITAQPNAAPNATSPPLRPIELPDTDPSFTVYRSEDSQALEKRDASTKRANPSTVHATANIHLPSTAFQPTSTKFDDIMKFFLERLSLNEHTQRDLLQETYRLQNELEASARVQDGIVREGMQSKQWVFQQMEYCKMAIQNIQQVLFSTVAQVNLQKDTMFQLFESQRQERLAEQTSLMKQVSQHIETVRMQERAVFESQLDDMRHQCMQVLKDSIHRISNDFESTRKEQHASVTQIQHDVYHHDTILKDLQSLMARIEMKFTGSFQHSDSNLVNASKLLYDYTTQTKREDESARERLKTDVYHNLEASFAQLHQDATTKADALRLKYEEIKKLVDEEQKKLDSLEKTSLSNIETRLSVLMDKERQNEINIVQVGSAIATLKYSLDRNRYENHSWRERVREQVLVMQDEMRQQGQHMRDQLMTEIRKMSRPMIVM